MAWTSASMGADPSQAACVDRALATGAGRRQSSLDSASFIPNQDSGSIPSMYFSRM